jgi:outer membrane lipoprotein-sorting protein
MNIAKSLLIVLSLAASPYLASAQQSAAAETSLVRAPLSLEQVITNLEQRNAQRAAALEEFEGKRIYRMQYRGFPSDKDAEMVVKVTFHAPNSKEFTVVSQTGSKFVIDRVFKKLLEGEQEAANRDNRHDTALTRQNYSFELAGYDANQEGGQYVLNLVPRTKNKFLYRGKIWVDAKDFAVVRIEAEPGKNPSFWIKKTDIAHRYVKVNDFWLPAENHTESFVRLGGKATLSIEYQDYKIIKSTPVDTAKKAHPDPDAALDGVGDGKAMWANRIAERSIP